MSGVSRTLIRALEILDLLAQNRQELSLAMIAASLDLPESTTHRLLSTLLTKGYVQQRGPNGPYSLGWRIALLARAVRPEIRIVDDLRPYLEELVRTLRHTVNLGALSGIRVIYLACVVPEHSMSLYTPPGLEVPAHATALGKCLLAYRPEEERKSLLSAMDLAPITPHTITSHSDLEQELRAIVDRGYARDRGELVAEVSCVAVPVLDANGRAVTAISVTAHSADLATNWDQAAAEVIRTTIAQYRAPVLPGGTIYSGAW